jgi:ABC-type branched-subunit amino acid transport system substrate-binding protein
MRRIVRATSNSRRTNEEALQIERPCSVKYGNRRRVAAAVPLTLGITLVIAACGSGSAPVAQQAPAPPPAPVETGQETTTKLIEAVAAYLDAQSRPAADDDQIDEVAKRALAKAVKDARASREKTSAKPRAAKLSSGVKAEKAAVQTAEEAGRNKRRAEQVAGATDIGVTKNAIKLGTINMHGMALGSVLIQPMVRGTLATAHAINDRGGILGRRLSITDCDDGPGEVSRAKACIKKLVTQDKIFSLVTGADWATAALHDDLAQHNLPYVGSWAYSQTEWQDPFMFPTHMSMVHEAMAGANWVKAVIKPKTYGLICLTSPEMQLACGQVQKILDASGATMVKKVDVAISETSMSSQVLAMRAAAPEHIVHYVINPATMVKFMVEAAQQRYYPPKGISGNHLAAEVLGSLFGKWPVDRYWTNTTFKLWGSEFMAAMNRYARGNHGTNHHVVQSAYVGVNLFAQAARQVGPNLTRERLMAALRNTAAWRTDASLDQRFAYNPAERGGSFEKQTWDRDNAQGREFMYKYTSTTTTSNPNGSPSGFTPDPHMFVIRTR